MAGKEKRRYINYRVDNYLRDRFLQSSRKHKPRELCGGGESLMRCFNHIKFCVVCCASMSQAVAPWMLCAMEVLTVLLIYFLATSRSLVVHHHRFSFTRSLEDVVALSCTRSAVLSLAYAVGQRSVHRPYLYTAYLLTAACSPYLLVKVIFFHYRTDGVAAAAVLLITGLSSVCHVLAARRTVEWSRRRYQMGLAGFGLPLEEGEDVWLSVRRPDLEDVTKTSDGGVPDSTDDVPPELLADDDSKFVELEPGLKVHYKEVAPPTLPTAGGATFGDGTCATTGIVLVHGFGGGVFSWRHIMEALAMQCQCRVIAFDRPAFGLTSRPKATEQSNPYKVSSQSQQLLQLCGALQLRRVMLMAHADGCLVILRAAATAASFHQQQGVYPQQLAASQHAMYDVPPYIPSSVIATVRVPDRARTAPSASSSNSSPNVVSDGAASPPADQLLSFELQQQQQQPGGSQISGLPTLSSSAAVGISSCGGGLSAAGSSAAVVIGDVATVSGARGSGGGVGGGASLHQLHPSGSSSVGLLVEMDACRSVVAADVVRAGSGSMLGGPGSGSAFSFTRVQAHITGAGPVPSHYQHVTHGGCCHLHPPHHHHTHSFGVGPNGTSSAGGGVLGGNSAAVLDHDTGSDPCDLGPREMDQASTTSSSYSAALASQTHHRRAQSVPGPVGVGNGCSTRSSEMWEAASCSSGPHHYSHSHCHHHPQYLYPQQCPQPMPMVLGLVLLHPNLSGVMGPTFFRILARSHLGRSILRPLLRSEVGEVANRRAWHNSDKLTSEVLELYKTPLRVEGWDAALIETTRQRRESCQGDLPAYCSSVEAIPTLIATGEHDRIVPPIKSESLLGGELSHARLAVLHDCGHLSHEEAPGALLEHLVPFCGEVLCQVAGSASSGVSGTAAGSLPSAAPGVAPVFAAWS